MLSGVGRCLAVGGIRNGEGACGAPANFNITCGSPFGLKEVFCCTLHTLAKLIDGIVLEISQSYCIVDSRTRLSHCESLTSHSYCFPWSWDEESVYTLLCHNIIHPSTPHNVLYPLTMFFTLRVKWMCSSHLVNLSTCTIDANFQGARAPVKNFRGAAAPQPPWFLRWWY